MRIENSGDNYFCLPPPTPSQSTGAELEKAPQVSWTQLALVGTQVLTLVSLFPSPSPTV